MAKIIHTDAMSFPLSRLSSSFFIVAVQKSVKKVSNMKSFSRKSRYGYLNKGNDTSTRFWMIPLRNLKHPLKGSHLTTVRCLWSVRTYIGEQVHHETIFLDVLSTSKSTLCPYFQLSLLYVISWKPYLTASSKRQFVISGPNFKNPLPVEYDHFSSWSLK